MLRSGLTVINLIQNFMGNPFIFIAHPINIKKATIVSSQGWLIKRLCLSSLTFEKHIQSLRCWFGKCGYPKKLVDNQLRWILESKLEQLPEHQTKHETCVPLVVTCHSRFHDLGRIVRKKFIYLYAWRASQAGL